MNILKKQRDAVGLSVFSDTYEYYSPEKGSDRHHRMILNALENLLEKPKVQKTTDTITFLHQIAEKIHRRSMIFLFTDMFQSANEDALFTALQHLKYNKCNGNSLPHDDYTSASSCRGGCCGSGGGTVFPLQGDLVTQPSVKAHLFENGQRPSPA